MALCMSPRGVGHSRRCSSISQESSNAVRESDVVARRNEYSIFAVAEQVRVGPDIRGNDWQPGGHVLENGVRHAFGMGRHHRDIQRSEKRWDVGDDSMQSSASAEIQIRNQSFELGTLASLPGNVEARAGKSRFQLGGGANKDIDSLDRTEIRDDADAWPGCGIGIAARSKSFDIDAVLQDYDLVGSAALGGKQRIAGRLAVG